MLNFQDLPAELVLKILSYSETKDLITYGQVSKRIRRISCDGTLWMTANFVKKIVKTELLEVILSKGCKVLTISNCTIVGHLSSNIKSQLRALEWTGKLGGTAYCKENIEVVEKLLLSCRTLQRLKMEGILLTPKMALSISKNGKTLQVLNMNHSYVIDHYDSTLHRFLRLHRSDFTEPNGNLKTIIKCCQELKELSFINENENWLAEDDLEFLAKNISPNVVKLNLSNHDVNDDLLKILLSRCNKIKVLILEATIITNNSLKTIRQYLNLTLEELSWAYYWTFPGFLELKSMPKLKILKLYTSKGEDDKRIQNLRQHLPHLMIRTHSPY